MSRHVLVGTRELKTRLGAYLGHDFDASALAKRYVRETGSQTVRRLLGADGAATSRLSEVEVASAIARRARAGVLWARAEPERRL